MKKIQITKDNLEALIAKQCDGIADANEIQALKEWKAQSEENSTTYQKVVQTNRLYAQMQTNPVDVDTAWRKVSSKMKQTSEQEFGKTSRGNSNLHWFKILGYAASILFVAAIGIWMNRASTESQYFTADVGMSYDLQDGSVIRLEKNSALSKLDKGAREYSFTGEAEFQIVHDDERPFLVHMNNNILVKDLGTVFRIESRPTSDTVFVSVTEGIAQFYTLTTNGIILESGEEGMYIKSKNRFYKRTIDAQNPYLSQTFEDATLGEIIEHLSYSFRKPVSVQNQGLKNCNLTVGFEKTTLPMVKEVIEETLNIAIIENQDSITIEGEPCDD
ncbi:MAG: FecR domain-containing protein [Bacteroidota bacterium]